jgi:hypothetical protein
MAIDVTKVHVGAARIFAGITNPATGTPPTLMTHTDGVPATGTDLGATEGDCVFTYVAEKTEILAEQYLGPIDVYVGSEMASLVFSMKEHNYTAMKLAFDNVGSVDDSNKTLFYGGGGTSILAPTTQALMFTSRIRNAPTKFHVGVMYKVYSMKGYKGILSKKNPAHIDVEIRGLVDTSRNAGDQMFQYFREK